MVDAAEEGGWSRVLMVQPCKAPPGTLKNFMIRTARRWGQFATRDSTMQIMAPNEKKRAREARPQKSKKRQKVEPRRAGAKQAGTEVASLDTLAWKVVALPDRLEDAEGFFGLEEIENVAVIRDDQSGRFEYRVGKEYTWSTSS